MSAATTDEPSCSQQQQQADVVTAMEKQLAINKEEDDDEWHGAMGTPQAEARERPAGTPKLLMRKPPPSAPAPAPSKDAAPVQRVPQPVSPEKSPGEREKDYQAARARIFGNEDEAAGGDDKSWARKALVAASNPVGKEVVAKGPSGEGNGFDARSRNAMMRDPDFVRSRYYHHSQPRPILPPDQYYAPPSYDPYFYPAGPVGPYGGGYYAPQPPLPPGPPPPPPPRRQYPPPRQAAVIPPRPYRYQNGSRHHPAPHSNSSYRGQHATYPYRQPGASYLGPPVTAAPPYQNNDQPFLQSQQSSFQAPRQQQQQQQQRAAAPDGGGGVNQPPMPRQTTSGKKSSSSSASSFHKKKKGPRGGGGRQPSYEKDFPTLSSRGGSEEQ